MSKIPLGSHWEYRGDADGKGCIHRVVALATYLDEVITIGHDSQGVPSYGWLGQSYEFQKEFKFIKAA